MFIKRKCIACKENDVLKTGNGRYYNLCPDCYKKMVSTSCAEYKYKKRNNGNENSSYHKIKKTKAESSFRKDALRLMGYICVKCKSTPSNGVMSIGRLKYSNKYKDIKFNMNFIQPICKKCLRTIGETNIMDLRTDEQRKLCREYQGKKEGTSIPFKQPNKPRVILRKRSAVAGLAKQASRHLGKSMTLIMIILLDLKY